MKINGEIHMNITFTNKETYIAWRAEWRADYAELTTKIRSLRREMNEAFRDNRPAANAQFQLRMARYKANEMMELRAEAKTRAAEQYAASRQSQAAA
jgi:hypothetical protein